MKQEVTLKNAKQNFKRNMYKYSFEENLENVIYNYCLREEEIEELKKYANKLIGGNKWKSF